ncbi:MAG: lipocalin-like domain-containing protein, partial [Alphaproteobacteria bacterium]|nr:lipocalin-like domain-containing protein [Alphaproteobacteria bacterium]
VTHDLVHALDPNMVGTTLKREIDFEGSRMTFTGYGPHDNVRNVIIWKRHG